MSNFSVSFSILGWSTHLRAKFWTAGGFSNVAISTAVMSSPTCRNTARTQSELKKFSRSSSRQLSSKPVMIKLMCSIHIHFRADLKTPLAVSIWLLSWTASMIALLKPVLVKSPAPQTPIIQLPILHTPPTNNASPRHQKQSHRHRLQNTEPNISRGSTNPVRKLWKVITAPSMLLNAIIHHQRDQLRVGDNTAHWSPINSSTKLTTIMLRIMLVIFITPITTTVTNTWLTSTTATKIVCTIITITTTMGMDTTFIILTLMTLQTLSLKSV
mmetsp:Transcript_16793/g.32733  ORF Transcript_16793/g.32733 Transcript_16793/m.32733 type:complete len:271 (-) Transcript_16793:603-1415(-)